MKKTNKQAAILTVAAVLSALALMGGLNSYFGATNFDRLVLGSANFETDPNPTKDLTFQNDEYISNDVNGVLDAGAADILTTGDYTGNDLSLSGEASGTLGYRYSGFSTISITNAAITADTLKLASTKYQLIKVRNTVNASDSVHVVTGLLANGYYLFKAVHTDTTIIFVDGGNLLLGATRTLDGDDDMLLCFSDGTNLIEVAFISNE